MKRTPEFNTINSIVKNTFGTNFWPENETPARIPKIKQGKNKYYKDYYHVNEPNDKLVMCVSYIKKDDNDNLFEIEIDRYGNVGDHHVNIIKGKKVFERAKEYINSLRLSK